MSQILMVIIILLLGFEQSLANQADLENLDLYCLKTSYPQISKIYKDSLGSPILELQNGQKVPYVGAKGKYASPLDVDLRESMAQIYPLEPQRPPTPFGFAPGRKRPYYFFEAIYGDDKKEVQKKLVHKKFLSSYLSLNKEAGQAFEKALPELYKLSSEFGEYLKPEGAYYWRKISGENVPSAHSFGIAMDLGIKKSPYWRWSKISPHPKQQSYPGEIVKIMEDNGFIWGGKWHEYDLMHYEYRPELICKAKMLKLIENGAKDNFLKMDLKR